MAQQKTTIHPFWKTKSLEEMSFEEWESLCDGCGVCCLEKLEDGETGEITVTPLACQYLDTVNCRCLIYPHRLLINPDCLKLSPDKVGVLSWLPETCAYRCIAEGRDLEWWHPLICGDSESVHLAEISVRDKILPGKYVHENDLSGNRD